MQLYLFQYQHDLQPVLDEYITSPSPLSAAEEEQHQAAILKARANNDEHVAKLVFAAEASAALDPGNKQSLSELKWFSRPFSESKAKISFGL